MTRELPDVPDWTPPTPDGGRGFDIELITPMFGGGHETRVNDPAFPIRPTAIRGQLHFWWRATSGASFDRCEDLRAQQSAIWGSTERASCVRISVENVQASPPVACAEFEPDSRRPGCYRAMPGWNPPFRGTALPYALFPFQGQLDKPNKNILVAPASCIHKASFRLRVRCPEALWGQVEPAIWAWVNFGGLGSRTRRGCGAVFCHSLAPLGVADLVQRWRRYQPEDHAERAWPTLAQAILHHNEQAKTLDAWNVVLERYREFRQGVGLGRNPGAQPNRPGRSRYPEPETIRTILYDGNPWAHDRLEHVPNDAFPRAEFGLPIVFHFQGRPEPEDTVLYPESDSNGNKRERMASPLILKPLMLQNRKSLPLILRLKTPALQGVDLRLRESSLPLPSSTVVRDPRLARYPNSPLVGSESGSAIEAFIKFTGFKEVTR